MKNKKKSSLGNQKLGKFIPTRPDAQETRKGSNSIQCKMIILSVVLQLRHCLQHSLSISECQCQSRILCCGSACCEFTLGHSKKPASMFRCLLGELSTQMEFRTADLGLAQPGPSGHLGCAQYREGTQIVSWYKTAKDIIWNLYALKRPSYPGKLLQHDQLRNMPQRNFRFKRNRKKCSRLQAKDQIVYQDKKNETDFQFFKKQHIKGGKKMNSI